MPQQQAISTKDQSEESPGFGAKLKARCSRFMTNADRKYDRSAEFFTEYRAYLGWFLLVCLLWFAWYKWGVGWLQKGVCGGEAKCDKLEALGQVGDLFGGINALFAALAFAAVAYSSHLARKVYQSDRQHSQDALYVEQVKSSFEWAYKVFSDDDTAKYPRQNREIWLTAARHLVRAQQIAENIESPVYKLIAEEQREYWRHKFLRLVTATEVAWPNQLHLYLMSDAPGRDGENVIEPISVKVILSFSRWNDERTDPINWVKEQGQHYLLDSYDGTWGRKLAEHTEFVARHRAKAAQALGQKA